MKVSQDGPVVPVLLEQQGLGGDGADAAGRTGP